MKRFVVVACALTVALIAPLPAAGSGGEGSDEPFAESARSPIDLELRDADIGDIVDSFGSATGLQVAVVRGVELQGKVTVDIGNTPWREALSRVLAEVGLWSEQAGIYIVIRAS